MPWWNRLLGEPGPEEQRQAGTEFGGLDAVLARPRPLVGAPLPGGCSFAGCAAGAGWPCAYTDGEGNQCPTRWCQAHLSLLEGRAYCADHAATVLALGDRPSSTPAVANRSPALTECLSRRLSPAVLAALEECRNEFAEAIISDPVQPGEEDGRCRWVRVWRLFDGAVPTLRVAIDVDEDEPPTVRALVDGEVVAEARCGAAAAERDQVASVLEAALRAGIDRTLPRPATAAG